MQHRGLEDNMSLTALPGDIRLGSVKERHSWKIGKMRAEKDPLTLSLEVSHAEATTTTTSVCLDSCLGSNL